MGNPVGRTEGTALVYPVGEMVGYPEGGLHGKDDGSTVG